MILTVGQLNTLCRFNRNFSVISLTLEQTVYLNVTAKLKAGKNEIEKKFTLDAEGQLVKISEDQAADAKNTSQ